MLLFVIPYIIIIYSLRKEVDIMNYISVKAASEKMGHIGKTDTKIM